MSARFRSDRVRREYTFDTWPYVQASLFAGPLLILASARLFSVIDGISLVFYGGGTLLELGLTLLFAELVKRDLLSPSRMRLVEYLNRVVIGLPLTIYLVLTGPHSSIGAVRFLASLLALPVRRNPSGYVWYIVFFAVGLLVSSALTHENLPSENHVFTAVTAVLSALAVIVAQRAVIQAKQRGAEAKRKTLHHERKGNRLALLQSRLFSRLLPPPADRIAAESREVRPEPGSYLLAAFSFPGLDRAAVESPREFLRDWDRFLLPVTDLLLAAGIFPVHAGGFLHAAVKLGVESAPTAELLRQIEVRGRIAGCVAALYGVLARGREMSAIRMRNGHPAWGLEIALALGPAVGLPSGGGDPSWTYRGSIVRRVEGALSLPEIGKNDPGLQRLWVEGALWSVVGPLVQGASESKDGWKSAGALRLELSKDGKGEEPAEDFLTRARYAGLIGND